MDGQVLAFAGVAALLTITPGADMALVTRNALAGGRRAALFTTFGINAGLFAWAALSAVGLAAVLSASAEAYTTLRVVGAAYLVYLGIQAIRSAGREPDRECPEAGDAARSGRSRAFRQGLLTNLLNPKIAVFYSTLLPQFVSPGDPVVLKSLLLAAIHNLMGLVWLSAYAHAVTRSRDLLSRPRVRRGLDRLTGAVLVGLGARLALERR